MTLQNICQKKSVVLCELISSYMWIDFCLFTTSLDEYDLTQIPHPTERMLTQITVLPEPQTTNMKRASNPGPTGYLSS
jgi:hypothetical protein